jgi:hypothetical protein
MVHKLLLVNTFVLILHICTPVLYFSLSQQASLKLYSLRHLTESGPVNVRDRAALFEGRKPREGVNSPPALRWESTGQVRPHLSTEVLKEGSIHEGGERSLRSQSEENDDLGRGPNPGLEREPEHVKKCDGEDKEKERDRDAEGSSTCSSGLYVSGA